MRGEQQLLIEDVGRQSAAIRSFKIFTAPSGTRSLPTRYAAFLFVILNQMKHKTAYIQNKKVFFNYEILETLEAGIELIGLEAKAVKASKGSLEGSYIIVRGGEAFLMHMRLSPYQVNNTPKSYEPNRMRRLILHKKEIAHLADIEGRRAGGKAAGTKGLTVVPVSFYNNAGRIKVEIAVVRGKKKYDKRSSIKKRETEREMRRELK